MNAIEVVFSLVLAVFVAGLYLLRAVSNILENGGEKFQFLSKGILLTACFGSVYHGGQD